MPEPGAAASPAEPDAGAGADATPSHAFAPELALVKDAVAFAEAVLDVAKAELHLSVAAGVRAAGLGAVAGIALAATWLCGTIAAVFALHTWSGSPALAFAVVALVHALGAAVALRQRAVWGARIGFARTRSAIAAAMADADKGAP